MYLPGTQSPCIMITLFEHISLEKTIHKDYIVRILEFISKNFLLINLPEMKVDLLSHYLENVFFIFLTHLCSFLCMSNEVLSLVKQYIKL